EKPEYNAVDASLWFIIAVYELFNVMARRRKKLTQRAQKQLWDTVDAILEGYAAGTRYGIHADEDGLIAAGVPDVPLTWLDARSDGHAVTPRIGKPVEVQALWLNALWIRSKAAPRWAELYKRGSDAF